MEGSDHVAIEPRRRLQAGYCHLMLRSRFQGHGLAEMRLHERRIARDCLVEISDGGLVLALRLERQAAFKTVAGSVRIEANRFAQVSDCKIVLACHSERDTAITECDQIH